MHDGLDVDPESRERPLHAGHTPGGRSSQTLIQPSSHQSVRRLATCLESRCVGVDARRTSEEADASRLTGCGSKTTLRFSLAEAGAPSADSVTSVGLGNYWKKKETALVAAVIIIWGMDLVCGLIPQS
jgi:hypothetical protein